MFTISEEVYGFKFMKSSHDAFVHFMVIRTPLMGYESWCKQQRTNTE